MKYLKIMHSVHCDEIVHLLNQRMNI